MARKRTGAVVSQSARNLNYVVGVLVLVALVVAAYRVLPPSRVVIATGPVGGSYYENAERYRLALRKEGINLVLKPVPNSLDIINYVESGTGGVQLGFVARPMDGPEYRHSFALGAIEQQPLFIFVRSKLGPMTSPDGLRGHRIVMPPQRSDTSQAALRLLSEYDVNPGNTSIAFLPIAQAVAALREGVFDAGFFMLDPQDEFITALAGDSNLRLMSLADTLTLSRLDPALHPLTLPRGIFDLENHIPPQDVSMVAATITVVARKHLSQAVVYMLLRALEEAHRGSSLINDAGTFPNLVDVALPPDPRALNYEKNGLPWAYENLPLWMASLVNSYLVIGLIFLVLIEMWTTFVYSMELVDFLFVHFWLRVLSGIEQRARKGHVLRPLDIKLVELAERALLKSDRRRRSEELIGRIRATRQ
jgi:TRAP-type uncharacterized transport system substrate-binding protein